MNEHTADWLFILFMIALTMLIGHLLSISECNL